MNVLIGHHTLSNLFIMAAKEKLHRVGDIIAIQGTCTSEIQILV